MIRDVNLANVRTNCSPLGLWPLFKLILPPKLSTAKFFESESSNISAPCNTENWQHALGRIIFKLFPLLLQLYPKFASKQILSLQIKLLTFANRCLMTAELLVLLCVALLADRQRYNRFTLQHSGVWTTPITMVEAIRAEHLRNRKY